MRMVKMLAAMLLLPWLAWADASMDKLTYGVKVGGQAPHALDTLQNAQGGTVYPATLFREKGLILLFNRSLEWCGYCKQEVRNWNEAAEKVRGMGYGLASLTYDAPETLAAFAQEAEIGFPLLHDADSAVIKAFGLLNENFEPGSRFYGIPHPAIYVITPERRITHRFAEQTHRQRPNVKRVLEVLQAAP